MTNKQNWLYKFLVCSLIFTHQPAQAQITPDNTLGAEGSRLTPNILINNASSDRIDGGAIRGSNLFHSFTEFNINDGQRVFFGNPAGIQNILTRVTGGQASNILGTLGVDGAANLFLINPNGILFGKNAQLDIQGSFLGTTANSLVFPNGVFSATNPSVPPLLTINVPIGLQSGVQPKPIISQENQLGIASNTLALIGGEITLDGSFLFAIDGQVQLGAVGGDTTVGLQVNDSSFGFSLPDNATRAPITLTNRAFVATSGDSVIKVVGGQIGLDNSSTIFSINGGSISIDATGLSLDNGSRLLTRTSLPTKVGDIQIQARDAVTLAKSSIYSETSDAAIENGGNISINATQLGLNNNSLLRSFTLGAANAGDIQIQAKDAVTVINSRILSDSNNAATGNGGNISIAARNITIAGDGTIATSNISTFTNSRGNAGNLTLDATDINVTKRGFVTVLTDGAGNTGDLTIRARNSVNVTENGNLALSALSSGSTGNLQIETGTFKIENTNRVGALSSGSGSAGSIFIQAKNAFEVINGQIITNAELESKSRSDITINTKLFNLTNGAALITNTYGAANGGNIVIRASESASMSGVSPSNSFYSRISSDTAGRTLDSAGNIIKATGNGGNIIIETPRLTLSDGAAVSTSSLQSKGNAGNITIRALDVELDGLLIVPNRDFSRTNINTDVANSDADVKAGTLNIDTERLRLSNGAYLNTSVQSGRGQAGNLIVRASDSIDIDGLSPENRDGVPLSSGLFAQVQTGGIGSGGSINVETGRLTLSNGGQISAGTFANGNAGNVLINANQIDLRGFPTRISTEVYEKAIGNAGDIRLNTQQLNLQDGAIVSSTTFGNGNAGYLTVRASDITLNSANSGLFSLVEEAANGNGGTVNINSNNLTILNGAAISARTNGQGRAGDIQINAKDSITLDGIQNGLSSVISARSTATATLGSGEITLNTNALSLNSRANILATTANTEPGGNVSINANIIGITNGGQILTLTSSSGQAGNITLNAKDVNLAGIDTTYTQRLNEFGRPIVTSVSEASGLYANTTGESSGKGGTIGVNAERLNIRDRANISVDSRGSGVAGDININAESVRLLGANIVAEAASQDGGNINIDNTDLLLLRQGSLISATAAEGGNGGNIKINARAIVAVPKEISRIRANAVRGNGGNISINTLGIFGIKTSPFPLEESDITASSQLGVQGQISITQPDVDPTQGIIELPNEVVDASNQIGQNCPRGQNAKPLGEFIITGRSLPPNPLQPLTGATNLSRLATLDGEFANKPSNTFSNSNSFQTISTSTEAIIEAQGWVKSTDGQIILVASVPEATPSARPTTAICAASK